VAGRAAVWALALSTCLVLVGIGGCGPGVKAERPVDVSLAWGGWERVEVRARNGSVRLSSSGEAAGARVTGTAFARAGTLEEAEARLDEVTVVAESHPERADTLLVAVRTPAGWEHRGSGANLVVEIPWPSPASVVTTNGSIVVERMAGEVELESSNGAVRASGIEGALRIRTSNGTVDVTDATGDLSLRTSNGSIHARGISGSVTATTSNGNVVVDADPGAAGRIEVETSNGSVEITVPAELGADFDLGTSNGRVRSSVPGEALTVRSEAKNRLAASMHGGGCPVRARSSNGSISLGLR
jgi:hypothetical protein